MISNVRNHRIPLVARLLLLTLLVTGCGALFAQTQPNDDAETAALRRQALQLYREGKFVDAMPLLEKLSGASPSDFVVKEHWAYCILEYSKTLSNLEERKAARRKARSLGVEAKKQGDEGELIQVLLSIPEDGSDLKFSGARRCRRSHEGRRSQRARRETWIGATRGYLQC